MSFFVVELKRALLPMAVVSLAGTAIVLAIERVLLMRGQLPTTVADAVDLFLYFGIVLMGYVGGERGFSREFKERDLPLLQTLPVPRWRIWLTVVSAQYLAVLVCTAAVIAVRPSVVTGREVGFAVALVLQGWLFVVSCCFAMLFLRAAFTYAVSVVIAGLTFIEATGRVSQGVMTLDFGQQGSSAFVLILKWGAAAIPLMVLFYLGQSLFFFTRGELLLARSRIKNGAILVVTTLGFVILLRLLTVGIDSMAGYTITHNAFDWTPTVHVQPGGNKVCILEWPEKRSDQRRIALIDGDTGSRIGHMRGLGLTPLGWSEDGQEFHAIAYEPRLLGSLDLVARRPISLISIDERGRTRKRLSLGYRHLASVDPIPGTNKHLLVTSDDGFGSLVVLDPDRVEISEVAVAASDGYPIIRSTHEGLLVGLNGPAGSHSAWLVGGDPHHPTPVPVAKDLQVRRPDMIVNGELQSMFDDGVVELLGRLSRPVGDRSPDDERVRGVHVLPTQVRDDTPVYYIETWLDQNLVRLFVRRPVDEEWVRINGQVPADQRYIDALRTRPVTVTNETRIRRDLRALDIDQVVAFVSEEHGRYLVNVYDPRLDRTVHLTDLGPAEPDQIPEVWIDRIPGMDGLLVIIRDGELRWFRYEPGSGDLEMLHPPAVSTVRMTGRSGHAGSSRTRWVDRRTFLLHRDGDGTEIHFHDPEPEIVRLTRDGRRVVLWSDR